MTDSDPATILQQAVYQLETGNPEQAAEFAGQALESAPENAEAIFLLGRCRALLNQNTEAINVLEQASERLPDRLELFNLLGHLLYHERHHEKAIAAFRRCVELDPDHVEAQRQLANLYLSNDQPEAIRLFERAHELAPDHADLLFDYAWGMMYTVGDTDQGAELFRKWLQLDHGTADRGSIAVQALNYPSNQKPTELAQIHFQWAEKYMNHLGREFDFSDHDFSDNRRIRLGMLSGDFSRHPVGRFAMLLCHHLDLQRFELFIYSNNHETDELKPSFEEHAVWCDVTKLTDDEAAKKIRVDRVDILLDLSGHTKGNRLGIVARKPAPIQAASFAYPNTTGLGAVDYRVTDPHSDPAGTTESLWQEKLEYMPHTPWLYLPPLEFKTETTPPPSTAGKPFTFGCLNNPVKTSRVSIRLWAEVLKRRPGSRIILFELNPDHGQLLKQFFLEEGVAPEQADIRPKGGVTYFLELHNEIDLMFDPFPYNGGVTTGDSFWMGVPVLCLEGDTYVSRQGVMQNRCLGLEAFIAGDTGEFIEKAVQISNNADLLLQLRQNLRGMLQQSALMDYDGYAAEFKTMLNRWWAKRCAEYQEIGQAD